MAILGAVYHLDMSVKSVELSNHIGLDIVNLATLVSVNSTIIAFG
jgi:hypothetical protein